MLAVVQVIGAVLRLVAGRWSDRVGTRLGPLRRLGLALAVASAVVAVLVSAPLVVLVPAIVVAGSLSQSWNGLSFTAAAELAGYARSGAALGLQQASLSLSSVVTPIGFAAIVAATSWGVGFGVAAAAALLGTVALRGLGEG
jgi:MFS family permease